jgi:acyl dehydratase
MMLTFEDFPPGHFGTFGPRHVTREEMLAFAAEFDPQPMHLDEEAASRSMLKGLSGSGWHLCSIMMRMMFDGFIGRAASLGSPGRHRGGKDFPQPSRDRHRDVEEHRPQRGGTGAVRDGLADHRAAPRRKRCGVGGPMHFFEDIEIGQRRELGSFTFTAELIKRFAVQFDPQRFHLDEEEGRKSLFGGLAASGWHVGSVCMKMLVADGQRQAQEAAARGEKIAIWGPSPGFRDLRWIKPVLAGDTIHFASEVESLRSSSSRPEWGILEARNTGTNQRGDLVFSLLATAFVPRRNPGS